MARPSRATQEKRNRERAKAEKQQEKREIRAQRKEVRGAQDENGVMTGEDPDLAGIYPGPQPPSEI